MHHSTLKMALATAGPYLRGENCIQVLSVHYAHVDACSCLTALVSRFATVHRLLHGQVQFLRGQALPTCETQTAMKSLESLQGGRTEANPSLPHLVHAHKGG